MLRCLICNKLFRHLGSHIARGHKMTARAYKTEFELPWNMPLITQEIIEKKRIAFELDREKYLKNLSKKYQFKKGKNGHRRISATEREKFIKRMAEVNKRHGKLQQCPVCRMKFNHLESHLYNKHQLLKVKM